MSPLPVQEYPQNEAQAPDFLNDAVPFLEFNQLSRKVIPHLSGIVDPAIIEEAFDDRDCAGGNQGCSAKC